MPPSLGEWQFMPLPYVEPGKLNKPAHPVGTKTQALGVSANSSVCTMYVKDRKTADSIGCIVCHDGSVAPVVELSHPVDLNYADILLKKPGVLSPGPLPTELVLNNGLVTCATCHDGNSTEPGHTAMPMDRSQMCFACHPY
jgi:hypothetical protein